MTMNTKPARSKHTAPRRQTDSSLRSLSEIDQQVRVALHHGAQDGLGAFFDLLLDNAIMPRCRNDELVLEGMLEKRESVLATDLECAADLDGYLQNHGFPALSSPWTRAERDLLWLAIMWALCSKGRSLPRFVSERALYARLAAKPNGPHSIVYSLNNYSARILRLDEEYDERAAFACIVSL